MTNILKIFIALAITLVLQPWNLQAACAEEGTIIDGTTISSEPFDQDQSEK